MNKKETAIEELVLQALDTGNIELYQELVKEWGIRTTTEEEEEKRNSLT